MKKSFKLHQQTSMWHFQPHDSGATLRATEVKPKLDRFLIEWCQKKHQIDILKEKKNWRVNEEHPNEEHPAFDYKLEIKNGSNQVTESLPGRNTLFFGNMRTEGEVKKYLVKAKAPILLTILCFHKDLMNMLEECLPTFFLLTNFGTRQSKGFGSFTFENTAGSAETLLTDWYGDKAIYKIDYGRIDMCKTEGKIFRDIEVIYQVMKGGIKFGIYIKGFINQYFLDKKVGGEKGYMKAKGIAPKGDRYKEEDVNKYRYIRALLGATDSQDWGRFNVKLDGGELERIPSPIVFKPIGNRIYILPNDVNPDVYGKEFKFSSSMGKGELCIPSKEEFDMDDFFAAYVEYINSKDNRDKLKKLKDTPTFVQNNIQVMPCEGVNH